MHAIAIEGTFDDCQDILKALFNDLAFRDELALSGVNSINWARILAQIVYYFTSAVALGAPGRAVSFAVPTGNFGDVLAGYYAKRMGLTVERLIVATNENDILARALANGVYKPLGVKATQSPSMDIQVSSNFERVLFEALGRDASALRALTSTTAPASRRASRNSSGRQRAAGIEVRMPSSCLSARVSAESCPRDSSMRAIDDRSRCGVSTKATPKASGRGRTELIGSGYSVS